MNKRINFFSGITLLTIAFTLFSCDFKNEEITPEVTLTELEFEGLVFIREEEKLAHDVYVYLFNLYDNQVFSNISRSEKSHMDLILSLLVKYKLEDPALLGEGEFVNVELQQLYNDLITKGSNSEVDALLVGATIEDLDIRDIEMYKTDLTTSDIIQSYDKLLCGSRNHLRAFTTQLANYGVTYQPQFISQEVFDSIITSEKEKCGQ